MIRYGYYIVFLFVLKTSIVVSQALTFDFIKTFLAIPDQELEQQLQAKNFRLITKDYKNSGDKLINKSNYYSNRLSGDLSIDGAPEIAIFQLSKHSKKSFFITFSQPVSLENFNVLESGIKKNFKSHGGFQSEKYESTIIKYTDEINFYYLFKEEDIYTLIISNYPLEDSYFNK